MPAIANSALIFVVLCWVLSQLIEVTESLELGLIAFKVVIILVAHVPLVHVLSETLRLTVVDACVVHLVIIG